MSINKSGSKNSIGLDLSTHGLNNSSSKQKFSFPKANRFDSLKLQYIWSHKDAIHFIKCPAPVQDELHLLDMAIKILELDKIRMLRNQPPITLKASLIIEKEALLLGMEDKYKSYLFK